MPGYGDELDRLVDTMRTGGATVETFVRGRTTSVRGWSCWLELDALSSPTIATRGMSRVLLESAAARTPVLVR